MITKKIIASVFMALIALTGLMGCSSEGVVPVPEEQQETSLQLMSYVAPYINYEAGELRKAKGYGLTRTGWLPDEYVEPAQKMAVGAFFSTPPSTTDPRRIWCNNNGTATPSDDIWFINGKEIVAGSYKLYGYMPYNAADVTCLPNGTFTDGAVLQMTGLNRIMTSDVCVMVGAKDGTGDDAVTGLQIGKFDCAMKSGGEGNRNYLFLLFEHLYAKLSFCFRVDTEYDAVRTIHLKKLQMAAYKDNTLAELDKKKMNATIELLANNTGDSPIADITFEDDLGSGDMDPVQIFDGDITLETEDNWKEVAAFTMPDDANSFYVLRSIYDVYDKKGNLIRKNSVADNVLNLRDWFNIEEGHGLERGTRYKLNLTIIPTYLYVLSDEDLEWKVEVVS